GPAAPPRRRGLADIALCGTMRDALLRREEAAALTWADIAREDDGSGRLTIPRSKTDPEAGGAVQYLGPTTMRDLAAIRPLDARPGDRVFGISGSQVSRRIAAAARAAGLGNGFSGHSPRVGMAQDLAASGAALPELMQAGRWSTSAMPALYVRAQSAGRGAVAKYYAESTSDSPETHEAASSTGVADPEAFRRGQNPSMGL
ncbi:MAG: tyrosine-type recombinase/integrase, partial [Spirochaetaceae bacterium]|nr:tyrosine-type recombinase/integrase [Spirochaetaceae bacterium]